MVALGKKLWSMFIFAMEVVTFAFIIIAIIVVWWFIFHFGSQTFATWWSLP